MASSSTPLLVLALAAAVLACVDAARIAGYEPHDPHHRPDYIPDYRPDYYGHNYQGRPGSSYQGPSTYFDEYDDEDIVRVNLFANPDFFISFEEAPSPAPAPAPATTGKVASAPAPAPVTTGKVASADKSTLLGKSTFAGKTVGTKQILDDNIYPYPIGLRLSCDTPSEPYGYSKSSFPSAAVPVEFPTVGQMVAFSVAAGPEDYLLNPIGFYKLWGQVAVRTEVYFNFGIALASTASECDSRLAGITDIVAEDGAVGLYTLIVRPQWTLDPRHFSNYYTGFEVPGKRTTSQGTKAADGIMDDDCDCAYAAVMHGPVTLMNGVDVVTNGTLTVVADIGYAPDELSLVNPNKEFPDPLQNPFLGLAVHNAINSYKGLKNICSKYHDSIPTVVPQLMHLEFPRMERN